uniref:transposase n=1 Tax=uncultured Methanosphaera sp. TaxID=262501 RepID=UPI0025955940
EYICPLNVKLPLQRSQRQEPTKKGRPGKIIHQYYSNECNKCEHKAECTKSTTRVISDYGSDLKKALEQKMEDPKIQEEYKKRSQTVEPPFRVLKQYKNLNTVKVTGKKNNVETRTGYKIAGYNLRRLENIMKNDNKNRDKILDLIKKITKENTYIKISIIYY